MRFAVEIKRNGKAVYTEITANNINKARTEAAAMFKTFTGNVYIIGLN